MSNYIDTESAMWFFMICTAVFGVQLYILENRTSKRGFELLKSVLDKLELKYKEKGDNDVIFAINDNIFNLKTDTDGQFLFVQHIMWYEAPLDDIDNLSLLQRAVNRYNASNTGKIVYTYDHEGNKVNLHTYADLLWVPEIPNIDNYLLVWLRNLVDSHDEFNYIMDEYRKEQHYSSNQIPN